MNTTLLQEYHAPERAPLVIERFLRDREGVWRQIRQEYRLNALIGQMLASSTVSLASYGLVMGSSHSVWQSLASAIKMPVLFLLTLAICLPTLYLFNLLCGGRLSARQALALVLSAITVTSALTLAFAPITLFFMITAQSYPFFILLNTAILTLTGSVGLSFLNSGMRGMNTQAHTEQEPPAEQEAPTESIVKAPAEPSAKAPALRPRPVSKQLIQIWMLLYGFVGTQLAWTLRPFHGDPSMPFILFRPIESNFYIGVIQTIVRLFH
jgi:hypothetical protein